MMQGTLHVIPSMLKTDLKCRDCVHYDGADYGRGYCNAIMAVFDGLEFPSPMSGNAKRCQSLFKEMPF